MRLALVPLCLAAACTSSPSSLASGAETAAASTAAVDAEGGLFVTALDGTDTVMALVAPATPTAQGVADFIATHVAARYSPAGCVAVTENGLTITEVFSACVGPRAQRQITGELDLVVSSAASGNIAVDGTASGLQINDTVVDLSSQAVYSWAGGTKQVAVTTQGTGTDALGLAFTHDGDYTTTWDATCRSLDGAWTTEQGDLARSTSASVVHCDGQCPTGTITRDSYRGRTLTISFDGTTTAKWTSSSGASGTLQLTCG